MDPKYSSGRTKASVCKYSTEKRGSHNKFCKYAKEYILEEVQSLLEKHAIEHVPKDQEGQGYYSTFFIVPKKDGGFRPILNLRELNTYLKVPHFKMETLKTIICALEQNDWALSMDLKDAYLHVAVFPPHRKYLRFCIMGNHYQVRAMPFGLAVAPRIFTKLMAVIGSYLRAREIQIYMYLDDWLIKNQNREILVSQSRMVLQLIERLGLIVNHAKSHLVPSQVIQYLGAVFNLQEGMIYPTLERCTKIQEEIRLLMSQTHQTAQLFLHVLGLMASCIDLTPLARLHMRPIQFYTLSFWRPHKDSLFHVIPVQDTLIQHLKWWQDCNNIMAGTPLRQSHSIVLWTDASQMGWGAHMEDHQVSGTWTVQEKEQHINWLEMKAVQQALIHFRHILLGKKVLLRCDNSTVVSHINKQGGTKSFHLCCLTWEIFQWAVKNKVSLRAAHIPGKRNVLADDLSRGRKGVKLTEWSLDQEIVSHIFQRFTTPNLDLFATRENRKLQVFCSPYPDPQAWATDALSVDWKNIYAYAFPPPIIIPQVLKKVRLQPCTLILEHWIKLLNTQFPSGCNVKVNL